MEIGRDLGTTCCQPVGTSIPVPQNAADSNHALTFSVVSPAGSQQGCDLAEHSASSSAPMTQHLLDSIAQFAKRHVVLENLEYRVVAEPARTPGLPGDATMA